MGLSHKVRNLCLAFLVAGSTLLYACQATPTPNATPTHNSPDYPTNTPTAVYSPTPIPTLEETVQPSPTFTLEPSPTVTNSPVPTATFSPTPSPTPSPSPTPVPRYDVAFNVFNDRNTNSVRSATEPALSLQICLDSLCAVSDADGNAYFSNISAGKHGLSVSYGSFPFYNQSLENTIDLRTTTQTVTVNRDLVQNVGLSAGLIPFFVKCEDMGNVPLVDGLPEVMNYVDLDPSEGVRTWNNEHLYNNHKGTDFVFNSDVNIIANVSGTVYAVVQVHRTSGEYFPNDWMVVIQSGKRTFFYGHLQETSVMPEQKVVKGDLIGRSIQSLYPIESGSQHIHFEVQEGFPDNPVVIDPFNADPSLSLWSVPNTPVCF